VAATIASAAASRPTAAWTSAASASGSWRSPHSSAPRRRGHRGNRAARLLAAGAGGGGSAARTLTVDRDGAINLLRAAANAGVPRYLIISAAGTEDPPDSDDGLSIYLRAKADADAAVQSSDLQWTILRPGPLSDDPGTGRVRVDPTTGRGTVPRDDVAAALARLLHDERAAHRVLYVNGGDQPLDQALEAVLSG